MPPRPTLLTARSTTQGIATSDYRNASRISHCLRARTGCQREAITQHGAAGTWHESTSDRQGPGGHKLAAGHRCPALPVVLAVDISGRGDQCERGGGPENFRLANRGERRRRPCVALLSRVPIFDRIPGFI